MDFQISSGSGRTNRCPDCGKKLMVMVSNGYKKFVCSCGYLKIFQLMYPYNEVKPDQTHKS
jgi:phage FluMu protein Com